MVALLEMDTTIKILQCTVHLVVIVGAITGIWIFCSNIRNNLADITFKVINEFGYTIQLHCPRTISHLDWQQQSIRVRLNFH